MPTTNAPAFPATLGHAAFWPAAYPAASPACGQTPILCWLVETLRPATVLGLGLAAPDGYFALCQAIKGLDVPGLVWGFGAWDSGVPAAFQSYNSAEYGGFSRLARLRSVTEVLGRFDDGLFDLILLDPASLSASLPACDSAAIADQLRRLSSPRGVVVVQGGAGPEGGPALAQELAARHPTLRFDPQLACSVMLTGSDPVPLLAAMAAAPRPETAALNRLGASHLLAFQDAALRQAHSAQQADLDAARQQSVALQDQLADTTARLAALAAHVGENREARMRDVRVLTLRLEEMAEDLRKARQDADDARAAARQFEQEGAQQATELAARLDAELAAAQALRSEVAELRLRHFDETTDLQSEIFVLTQTLGQTRAAAETQASRLAASEAQVAALRSDLQAGQAQLSAAETALAAARTDLAAAAAEHDSARAQIAALQADLATLQQARRAATEQAAAAHAAEMANLTQQIVTAQAAVAARDATCAKLTAELAALRKRAAAQAAQHKVRLALREWQIARLSEKSRLGSARGPSGDKLADEIAATSRHPLFDAEWYLGQYPDVRASGLSAAEHFVRHGLYDGRDPGPNLRLLAWFAANPQALANRRNPLLDGDLRP